MIDTTIPWHRNAPNSILAGMHEDSRVATAAVPRLDAHPLEDTSRDDPIGKDKAETSGNQGAQKAPTAGGLPAKSQQSKEKLLRKTRLEAKWLYNWLISDRERLNLPANKVDEVEVKVGDSFERRRLEVLGSQIKQEIAERLTLPRLKPLVITHISTLYGSR